MASGMHHFLPLALGSGNIYSSNAIPMRLTAVLDGRWPADPTNLTEGSPDRREEQLASLRDLTSTFIRRYQKINRLREKLLLHRSRTKHQWSYCRDYRRFVVHSQTAFVDAVAAGEEPSKLQKLHQQVLRDHEEQNELGRKTEGMETELASLEFDMQQKENALAAVADIIFQALIELTASEGPLHSTTNGSNSPVSSAAPTATEIPHLVQFYFDKAGDVNVALERLADLKMEYADLRTHRQLQQDQGAPLDETDADFEGIYFFKRNKLEEAVTAAMQVAEMAKKMCLSQSLDPNSFMPSKLDDSTEAGSLANEPSKRPSTPSSRGLKISDTIRTTDAPTSTSVSSRSFPKISGKPPPLDDRVTTWMSELKIEDASSRADRPAEADYRPNMSEARQKFNNDWYISPDPTQVYVRGIDRLEPDDILRWALECETEDLRGMQWIDNSSANLIYGTELAARKALDTFSAVNVVDPYQLRPAKKLSTHPEIELEVRRAVLPDVMAPRTQDADESDMSQSTEQGMSLMLPPEKSQNGVLLKSMGSSPNLSASQKQSDCNDGSQKHRREASWQL